jgi:hypothetical protein
LGEEGDFSLYYKLVEEMRESSEWISWHDCAHRISKNPTKSKTFNMIIDRLCEYFNIENPHPNIGTRLNWYADYSDYKPLHHDKHEFNSMSQNITVGASFGSMRELVSL